MTADLFSNASIELKKGPDFSAEARLQADMGGFVCGVDEVGRGPLAGPVVAAAVILDHENIPAGLNDSKKLTAKRREQLYDQIHQTALAVSVAEASVEEIDSLNILQASLLAMRRAVDGLAIKPSAALVDGNQNPGLDIYAETLVKGDSRSLSVAAASIVAKVFRDSLMKKIGEKYPEYGFETNAGYGVPKHMAALKLVGITHFHRKSFAPIRDLISKENPAKY